jgi:hydrogenase-4 membrane subunit HyfE
VQLSTKPFVIRISRCIFGRRHIMKKIGIFLILAGLICILAFVFYTIALQPEIPLLIKFGVTAAIFGLIIVISALVVESIKKNKRRDEDDLSKY